MIMPVCDPEQSEPRHLQAAVPLVGKRLLEVGCGNGRLTWRYAQSANCLVGIDPDRAALREAHKDCPPPLRSTVRFVLADARTLPFAASQFDIALLAWSL